MMWRAIRRSRVLGASCVIFFFVHPITAEIALTALPLWTSADPCARSCASSVSQSYSASASCPTNDPAGCECSTAGHSLAAVAHDCAAKTCRPTYTEAPPYARLLFSTYCATNGYDLALATNTDLSGRTLPLSL
jgi:hypothetical protein